MRTYLVLMTVITASVYSIWNNLCHEFDSDHHVETPAEELLLVESTSNPEVVLQEANGKKYEELLAQNLGKVVVVDIWATW